MRKVLFVCLGNICRSPLAEAAFRREAEAAGLAVETDSAGTGAWHIGKAPDPRSQAVALKYGIDIRGLRARQVNVGDFRHFDHIIAMDQDNLAELRSLAPDDATAEVSLLLDLLTGREGEDVADPYYGGEEGFEVTWADVSAAARALVQGLSPASD